MSTSVEQLLRTARTRLRRRSIWTWFGLFFGGGALTALCLGLMSRLWWPLPSVSPWLLMLGVCGAACLLGACIGAFRPILNERQLALLLDRSMKTDEVLVTQHFLEASGKAETHPEIVADLQRRIEDLPRAGGHLPRMSWRGFRWPLVLAALATLVLFLPQREGAVAKMDPKDKTLIEEQADKLEDTLEELEDKFEEKLPEDIEDAVENLVDELQSGSLSETEAAEQIQALQDMLDEFEDEMAEANDLMEDLADAADELAKDNLTQDLSEAMENADMESAEKALDDLMESMENASEQERQEAGDALKEAGEQLSQSSNSQLQEMGEHMKQAGESMSESGTQENQGQQSSSSSQSARESTQQAMEDLKERMQQSREMAERMKEDAERLQRSQELNGALEGANQQMGGESGVDEGEGQQGGQGDQGGEGQGAQAGQGEGAGENGQGVAVGQGLGSDPGQGHTWEDEGTHETEGGHRDANRLSDRNQGLEIDDFEQFYEAIRMEGTDSALTGVDAQIDESGQMESLPSRLTEGSESSSRPLLDVPDGYRDAAERAMENERVPPGYRNSVRQYFESVE